ncbi:MAG: CHRD domain-containing protein [Longimicrobiales bacterium]
MNARKYLVVALVGLASTGVIACDEDDDPIEPGPEVFVATLNAANEVATPPVVSNATGTARVEFTATGLTFRVTVASIVNITAAHIHASPTVSPTTNGGVVLNIINAASTVTNGLLAEGTATSTNAGNAISMDSLKVLIRGNHAYVNVHNTANPQGHIRGMLVPGQ